MKKHEKTLEQVNKKMLSSVVATMISLRDKGVTRRRQRSCGARGMQQVVDRWEWPKSTGGLLFPSPRSENKPKSKDSVCHLIAKIRKSFVGGAKMDLQKIRSHSGRHRMINDLKRSDASTDAAMAFARIRDKKTFDGYGRLDDLQVGHSLDTNKKFKRALQQMYKKK